MAKSLRSQLYRAARLLGDIEAANKGTYVKRRVRANIYKKTNRSLAKFLRGSGF
jgi:hypothetical protein